MMLLLSRLEVHLIPIGEPDVISDSIFYNDLFKDEPSLKLQHEFSDIASIERLNSLSSRV